MRRCEHEHVVGDGHECAQCEVTRLRALVARYEKALERIISEHEPARFGDRRGCHGCRLSEFARRALEGSDGR